MLKEAELVDQLCRSTVYQDFRTSFLRGHSISAPFNSAEKSELTL